MPGYTYILECNDGTYYTGSTKNLEQRLRQHQSGNGSNYTKKKLPVTLVYLEEFWSVKDAFEREKQIQGWSHKKKKALIENNKRTLKDLSICQNETSSKLPYWLTKNSD